MFTGIIDHCGKISAIENNKGATRLTITCAFNDLKEGESISVDGACLTVINPMPQKFSCEVSPETKRLTIASHYREGTFVNLERALLFSDRLGGHFVSGHVDQIAKITHRRMIEEFMELTISGIHSDHQRWVLKKGSIAINGVSLTVNTVIEREVTVMVVPHTLQRTNLKLLAEGDHVNVELDWLVKLITQSIQERLSLYEQYS